MRSVEGRARIVARTRKGERVRSSVLNLQSSFFHAASEVFLSGDNEEKDQLSQAKMPQEPAALTACRPDAPERQAVCHGDCEAAG